MTDLTDRKRGRSNVEKVSDPDIITMYFDEMGEISTLTRESEVALAQEIERHQQRTNELLARHLYLFEGFWILPRDLNSAMFGQMIF